MTSDDKDLNQLVENLNHYVDIEITYCFGNQKEVLDGSVVKDWLTYDKKGKVLVKDGAISDYIASLADKYDTYDKPRKFKTSDGTYVTVEGGSYGWKIDQTAEAEELTKLMEEEPHMERTPIFAQEADSWENGDMGDTYVEVDLTKQHLWMYKEGKLIVESDFVSGTMTPARVTPPGIFRLYYKNHRLFFEAQNRATVTRHRFLSGCRLTAGSDSTMPPGEEASAVRSSGTAVLMAALIFRTVPHRRFTRISKKTIWLFASIGTVSINIRCEMIHMSCDA